MSWEFGSFQLDEEARELRLRGREIVVEPLVFDVLADLVRNRDRVVTKEELLERVWPDALVTDASLQRVVSLARSALRSGGMEEAIKTFPRRGYRFSAEITEKPSASASSSSRDAATGLVGARRAFERNEWDAALVAFLAADR